MSKYTFAEFQAEFPNDEACLEHLMRVNYGGTEIVCSACGIETKFHLMSKRRAYACQECGHHIYPCAGTIFHKSSTKLTLWFFAMYLMTSTRHGVAAKELQRQLGVTYKTAWRMAHELRKHMANADRPGTLSGHVEVDETYVGGYQRRENQQAKGSNKTIVIGMVERDGGKIIAGPIPDLSANTLGNIVRENVVKGSTISTDELRSYNALASYGYTHGRVNHKAEEWVRGEHHTNTLEGHWSHFKRAIRGTHTSVSRKHMWKYVSEFSYRRNHRHSHAAMFGHLVSSLCLPRLQDA
jgi:transposase